MAFLELPGEYIPWWAMRRLGIDKWLVCPVLSMYKDVRSRVRVGEGFREELDVVGVHRGSVLSRLLLIIVLEAPSREFHTGLEKARQIDGRTMKGAEMFKAGSEFCCYLGNMLSAGGDCELTVVIRCECLRRKFCQLLPLPIYHTFLVLTGGLVYLTGMRSVMLHATETHAMTMATLNLFSIMKDL